MTCPFCSGILNLFQEAVAAGLQFSPDERRELMERCERSMAESTAVLASRGWFEFPDGSWRRLDSSQVQ